MTWESGHFRSSFCSFPLLTWLQWIVPSLWYHLQMYKSGGMVRCRRRGKTEEDGEGAILISCSLCFRRCHDWGRDWGWYSTRWEEDSYRLLLSSGQVQAALQWTEVSLSCLSRTIEFWRSLFYCRCPGVWLWWFREGVQWLTATNHRK